MKKITGILFLAGAILVNVPYALLISNFNYPDILREPAGEILTKFSAGGSGLITMWLFFALTGLPLLIATLLLGKLWAEKSPTLVSVATTLGIIGFVAQLIGLLRWVFVVPVLALNYTAPGASEAVKEAAIASFQTIHQFGGVLLGEYVGQLFTIGWMLLISIVIIRTKIFKSWIGWFGIITSAIYILAQTELLHTSIPQIPSIDIAGFAGSILWIIWMVCLGILLLLKPKQID
jgi:hypothetical protein